MRRDIIAYEDGYDPDFDEPVGCCQHCGCNLYADDDYDLCDQCQWWSTEP